MLTPNLDAPPSAVPMAKFRDYLLDLYRPPLRAKTTFISLRRSLDLLAEIGGVETTADLTTTTIARFVADRSGKENPNTTRTHLRKLSAACSIAVGEGWLRVNPFTIRRGWVRAVSPKSPRIHSREEIARILDLAAVEVRDAHPAQRWKARRLQAVFATVAYTGLRKMEALTLRVEDVRLRDRLIILTARSASLLKPSGSGSASPA